MSDEPFGRQPKPVDIKISSDDMNDAYVMADDIFRLLFNRSGSVERWTSKTEINTIQITYYPRAVND